MKEHLKQRILDLAIVGAIVGLGVGGYHLYSRTRAHNALDQSLIGILSAQDAAQLEQRCLASGFVKAPKEATDGPTGEANK